MIPRSLLVLVMLLAPASAHAELRVAQPFQDNMVLQRDIKLPVWGWADAGAAVKVSFAGQDKSTTADAKGYWIVELDPLAASSEGRSLAISGGGQTVERKNVVVGEVWVLSGQSNMARPLRNDSIDYPFFKDYANDAEYPLIRFADFGAGAASTPLDDVEPVLRKDTPWKVLNKTTAMHCMSIGFFVAKRLHAELKVPIGLVQIAVSGTPQTAWMAKETIEQFPAEKGAGSYFQNATADAQAKMARSKAARFKSFADYEATLDAWRKDPGATERTWPGWGDGVITDFPSVLYNTRVYPLAPLAFRGMLWHQGEAGPGGPYGRRLVAMVQQYRRLFKHDFVFIFGTLTRKTHTPPPMAPQVTTAGGINLSMVEGDRLFGHQGNAALVNFYDLGNPGTHWAMKEEAGRRMALAALDRAYGRPQTFTGPQLIDGAIAGGSVSCRFRYTGSGLKHQPSIDGISGVVVVDTQGARHWGHVKVTTPDTLVISAPNVANIAAVCYGMHANPHETLFNGEGFAAFQFIVGRMPGGKTDDPAPLVQILAGDTAKRVVAVSHVRRDGYLFNAYEHRGPAGGTMTVRAYVPAEWKGVEVRLGDKPMDPGAIRDDKGRLYITLEAPVNGPSITVAQPGHAEALSKVHRF